MAFELHGLVLALHYEARFLKSPGSTKRANSGFDNILARYGCQAAPNISAVPKKLPARASKKAKNNPGAWCWAHLHDPRDLTDRADGFYT